MLSFDSPRVVRSALRIRRAVDEKLTLLAVRVGRSHGVGIHEAREASLQVHFARSATDLPPSEFGYSDHARGYVSCTYGTITTFNGISVSRTVPLDPDAVGRWTCQGRHKAVHLAGRGWACH